VAWPYYSWPISKTDTVVFERKESIMPTYLIPDDLISTSPSRCAGISKEHEIVNRIYACELISQAGIMLRLSQANISTAQILFHRFYYRKSMIDYKVLQVAMAALFLGTKVEESNRNLRDVLNVFDRVLKRRYLEAEEAEKVLDRTSKRYARWSNEVRKVELVMLRELGYTVYVDHPHRFILFYVRTLFGNGALSDTSKQLAQKAWNYLNDAMRTDVCLRYRPEIIATAAIYLTVRMMQISLPSNPPWYRLFGATKLELEEISSIIAELYTRDKAEYIPVSEKDKKYNIICKMRDTSKKKNVENPVVKAKEEKKEERLQTTTSGNGNSRKERKKDKSRSPSSENSSSSSSPDRRRRRKRRKRSRSPSSSSASRSRSRNRGRRRRPVSHSNRGRRTEKSSRNRDNRDAPRERERDRDHRDSSSTARRDRDRDRDRDHRDRDHRDHRDRDVDKKARRGDKGGRDRDNRDRDSSTNKSSRDGGTSSRGERGGARDSRRREKDRDRRDRADRADNDKGGGAGGRTISIKGKKKIVKL